MPYRDKEQQREYQRQWMADRRAKYVALHGGKCVDCERAEFLEFDHEDPSEKISHRIWSWSEVRIEEELGKCKLRCKHHHSKKSIAERNYPKRKHGTNLMYGIGCRCAACKQAHAAVNAKYK